MTHIFLGYITIGASILLIVHTMSNNNIDIKSALDNLGKNKMTILYYIVITFLWLPIIIYQIPSFLRSKGE